MRKVVTVTKRDNKYIKCMQDTKTGWLSGYASFGKCNAEVESSIPYTCILNL
jgi:hypothetical protein